MNKTLFLLGLTFSLCLTCTFGQPCFAAAQAAPGPRLHLRFDAGWRFHQGDTPGAEQVGYADAAWRRVDLPHDWSIEDLPPAGTSPAATLAVTSGQWQFTLGDDPAWKNANFDDSGWKTVTLPAYWSTHLTGDFTQKFGWYRRRFTVPAALRGHDVFLLLGKVDDSDETFVNGVKVGGMGSFPPDYVTAYSATRRYLVPSALLKGDGTDLIAVRVYNGGGDAGIYEAAALPDRSGPFDADSEGGAAQGFTEGGVGWYRKTFPLSASLRGKPLSMTFDGVYMNSQVWFNGHLLGTHPYGYTGFSYDLTPYARLGGTANVLAVRVDASGKTSRWYSGAGIYRHVWLTATAPTHIAQWGVYVTTPQVSAQAATVRVRTTIAGRIKGQSIALLSVLMDARGRAVGASADSRPRVAASGPIDQQITVSQPHLWSPDRPALYHLVSTVMVSGKDIDQTQTTFGIRSISFDAVHGMLLNGKSLKLRGGCVHHDDGPLGARAYDRAEERRVALLKAAGFNAIRTSHNPPSPAFLDACDRLGVLVMDEDFDCWKYGKNPQDYGRFFDASWKSDIDSMVQRTATTPASPCGASATKFPSRTDPKAARTPQCWQAKYAPRTRRAPFPRRPIPTPTSWSRCWNT